MTSQNNEKWSEKGHVKSTTFLITYNIWFYFAKAKMYGLNISTETKSL